MTVVLMVLGGFVVWLIVAIGVGRLFGAVIRLRDRDGRPDPDHQPTDQEGPP